jgi:glycosyltransferase involved in cell wall biosynthesis
MTWNFMGHFISRDGYGQLVIKTGEALRQIGADVRLVDMCVNRTFSTPGEKRWTVTGNTVVVAAPDWWEYVDISAGQLIGFTMFESTRLPDGRADLINHGAAACVVPSPFCAEVFRACGVTVPVHVVPLGIDPDLYYPIDRSDHAGPYTFLWSGTPDLRKGWDLVYRAFYAAFGGRRDVQLVMHFRELPRGVTGTRDKNVRLVSGSISTEDWLRLLREADCFVFPSRGEGWGLPPREAAATGLPVIATDWGGLSAGIESWAIPLRVKGLAPAEFGGWDAGEIGEWAEPDFDGLVERMQVCFDHRDGATLIGRRAADWLSANATWERTAVELDGIVGAS